VRVVVVDRTVVSDFDTCIAAILYNAHRSPYRRLYRRFCFGDVIFTARRYMLARYVLWPCVRLCLFATKTAKRRITQRKPDDSRGPVVVREYTHACAVYTAGVSERAPLFTRSGSHHPRSILNRISVKKLNSLKHPVRTTVARSHN